MRFRSLIVAASGLVVTLTAAAQPSLKAAFKDHFLIGVALKESQFEEKNVAQAALVKSQFNSITAENVMKWEKIQPRQGDYHFGPADRFFEFGERNEMFIIGHTLVWHSQAPDWLFKDAKGNSVNRETLLARMREHIHTVVGRYKGRIQGWDVVNEALEEDGTLRKSPWLQIIGDDYIAKAFEFAHEADPKAELYYNDYSIEGGAKRDGAIALLKKLKAAGVPITGVGMQGHMNMKWPTMTTLDESIKAFGNLNLKVMITELDVDVLPARSKSVSADVSRSEKADPALNPYAAGLPEAKQQALARRYAELFKVYLKHQDIVSRVTFWGVTDGDTWLNDWPIKGRSSHPLLFDRLGKPKAAFHAVIETLKAPDVSGAPAIQPQPTHDGE
jgi:endo-1,4-beta-xylanase